MRHFATEDWIDFVNQMVSGSKQISMKEHLATGCQRCREALAMWQKVRQVGAVEGSYQPPSESVRFVKAAFTTAGMSAKPRKAGNLVEVLFDSFLQPALQGARSTGAGTRQMLYRADPYQVDVQIETKPDNNRLAVTGQVLNVSRPELIGSQIQVTLSNRRGSVVHAMTNQFGEFRGEIDFSGDLELSFPRPEEKPIVISLRNALERLPGGKS